MNQRKLNSARWYVLGLAVILAAGCMIVSVGTAFARYRLDNEHDIKFTNRETPYVALGSLEKDEHDEEIFLPDTPLEWTAIRQPDGSVSAYALDLTISNYQEITHYDSEDIRVRIRLIGTLDAWNPREGGYLTIADGTVLEDGTPRTWTATVTAIGENTAMYHAFGEGWVFRFLDAYGQELTWELEGGKLTWQTLRVTMPADAFLGTSLIQLQVLGERTE